MEGYTPLSNREKVNIFLPLLLALALASGTWLGFKLANNSRDSYVVVSEEGGYAGKSGKVEEILRFIDARYLENEAQGKLEDAAIRAIIDQLDPHSTYISLSHIEKVNQSLSGKFEGIGIEFFALEDTIYVVGVTENAPSDSAGIIPGDKIIRINDTLVAGKGFYSPNTIDKLKGHTGTDVLLHIKRAGEKGLKKFTITRNQVPIYSIVAHYMLNKNTGLIKINRFSTTTYNEFMTALDDLVQNHGMKNLVVDLRDNPGGYLDQATRILDQLFTARRLLVYTEGRSYRRKEYNSTGKSNFDIGKIAILINEHSASASEIIAGAIQDNDRGLIIGRRSFGKGLVQEQYKLTDGSALRLTVARYFTPSGRYIQKPYDGSEGEYGADLDHRTVSGELYSKDSIHITDSTVYKTVGGRTVYGGGGIIPDIFIPSDTTYQNPYCLTVNSYVKYYVCKYIDNKRKALKKKYPTFHAFEANYRVTENMFENFIALVESKDIERDKRLLALYKDHFILQIKSYIAKQLYADVGLYATLFKKDEMVLRATYEIERDGSSSVTNPSAMMKGGLDKDSK